MIQNSTWYQLELLWSLDSVVLVMITLNVCKNLSFFSFFSRHGISLYKTSSEGAKSSMRWNRAQNEARREMKMKTRKTITMQQNTTRGMFLMNKGKTRSKMSRKSFLHKLASVTLWLPLTLVDTCLWWTWILWTQDFGWTQALDLVKGLEDLWEDVVFGDLWGD